jgi:hypothetical protein
VNEQREMKQTDGVRNKKSSKRRDTDRELRKETEKFENKQEVK